jgi:hypothetical protein
VHLRERGLEAAQHERQDVGRDRRRGSHEELADASFLQLPQQLPALRQRLHRPLRVRAEGATLRRQPHPARRAYEQVDAELALQVLDPRRERGLRDVEHPGRLGDRAPFRDGEEPLDLGQQHLAILTRSMT